MVRPGQLRPRSARLARKSVPKQDGRLSRGEVRTRKRMAEAGAVFGITPVPRTPEDILGPGPRLPGPKAAGKWLTASVAADAADVVAAVFAEAGRRDPGHERTWIALADGNKDQIAWIRAQAAARSTGITIICDFIHVLEYLRDAAWCFFPEASPEAGPWVRDRAAAILDGRAPGVAAALRDAAAGLSAAKRKTAEKTARYLDTKAPWLDYPTALAAGWPISADVIEGACRHLVKTAWTSPAPAGAWNPPKPSSNSAPCTPTATSTPTGPTTCNANANATTRPATPSPPDAPSKGNAPMEHCCRYRDTDVPSWRLLPRAGRRIRVPGAARGAHGACGKEVAGAGRRRAGTVWAQARTGRDQLRDGLDSAPKFPYSLEFPRSFSRQAPHGALTPHGAFVYHGTRPHRGAREITARRPLAIGTVGSETAMAAESPGTKGNS